MPSKTFPALPADWSPHCDGLCIPVHLRDHIRMSHGNEQPVLVTGATGFIGRRLVHRLIESHHRVFCLVRTEAGGDALRADGAHVIRGDVSDAGSVECAVAQSQPDIVFHVAGMVRTTGRGTDDFMRVNAGGVANIAKACAKRSESPVLIVVSSLAAAGPCEASRLCLESDAPSPVSEYGRSKLAGELAAARYADAVPITLVRPPIVFGPADRGMYPMFQLVARWGLHVVPARATKEGQRLSLIHVDDLVEGLLLAAQNGERLPAPGSPAATGRGIYFFAGEDHLTYVQLGEALATALDRKSPKIIRLPGSMLRCVGAIADVLANVRRRPSLLSRDKVREALAGSWACSSDKARAHLGWSPATTLAVRLHETAQWYRRQHWL